MQRKSAHRTKLEQEISLSGSAKQELPLVFATPFFALCKWSLNIHLFLHLRILSCKENTAGRAAKLNLQTQAAQEPPQRGLCVCLCVLVLGRWADRGTKGHECGLLQIWLAALIRPQLCWIVEWINASDQLKFCGIDLFYTDSAAFLAFGKKQMVENHWVVCATSLLRCKWFGGD